ncbi:hypothetical protein OAE87_01630 [bacterium]|nr:hypothetical protein [bacterium]
MQPAYEATQFIESEAIPPDGTKVREVWEKSNKDGSRDKRYAENRQLQVIEYEERSLSGRDLESMKNICLAMPSEQKTFLMPYRHSGIFFRGL